MRVAIFNNYKIHFNDFNKTVKNTISYAENIGNIVFLESIARETGADEISIHHFHENKKYYEDNYDLLILSLANMLSPHFNMSEEILESLENTKIPICIFSIGIQVDNIDELEGMEISEKAKRVLKLSTKSGTIIGLRGEYTKIYLDSIGVKNTQVIGCPSIFYKKNIPIKSKNIDKILISGSFNGVWRNQLKKLFKFGIENNTDYLIQSESRILLDKYIPNIDEIESWSIQKDRYDYLKDDDYDYKYYSHENIDYRLLKKWMINKSIFFNDFDNWLSSMNYDLNVGVRFHGSVMSTLSGVPTLILSGDTRVDEFVKFHELPNININLFNDNLNPCEIYELIDYSNYSYKYDYLKNNYIDFLNKNGLKFIL
jgi:hypothetical protein